MPERSIAIVTWSCSWSSALARLSGRFTGTPLASIGAVTMKMISSTSITSTSGVTLISAIGARRPDRPIYLTLKPDLTLTIGDAPVDRAAFPEAVARATNSDREQRIFLRADKTVPYGAVMEVMNALRAAGYLKVALVALEGAAP